jgi:hypothetical protein
MKFFFSAAERNIRQMTSAAIGMTGPPGRRIVRGVAGILRRSTGTARQVPM